jgi:hypothetical protein
MLTPKEFRKGLRQLQYKDVSMWTLRTCKRLFDECDRNRDGLLSIKEFTANILDRQIDNSTRSQISSATGNARVGLKTSTGNQQQKSDSRAIDSLSQTTDKLNLSDNDEEEDDLFRRKVGLTDTELIRKVNDVLMEIVPREASGNISSHLEIVRSSVRRFFQRADPDFKGYVSEERFRAFLRRSGLQDTLTASELRRLTEKLKKRGGGREKFEVLIDYEK